MDKILIKISTVFMGLACMTRYIYQLINNDIKKEFIVGESVLLLVMLVICFLLINQEGDKNE